MSQEDNGLQPEERFNVVQEFADETWEYVRRNVTIDEAEKAVAHYINSVGAQMGTTITVLLTDMLDRTLFHWKYGKGIIFPIIKEHTTIQ